MKVHVTLRGLDQGGYNLQTFVEAPSLLDGLDLIIERWGINRAHLSRIHVQPDVPGADKDIAP